MQAETLLPGTLLYRGDWVEGPVPKLHSGAMWFHLTLPKAAGYVNFGESNTDKTKMPVIFVVETTRSLRLLRYEGNHVQDFDAAYGKTWRHDWLRRDLPNVFSSLANGPADGFFKRYAPDCVEYFILDADSVTKSHPHIVGDDALEEGERVKSPID